MVHLLLTNTSWSHVMRHRTAVASILMCISALAQAQAPQKPTPDQLQSMMDASMVSMLPMLARMTEVQLETQLKYAARPETAQRAAA